MNSKIAYYAIPNPTETATEAPALPRVFRKPVALTRPIPVTPVVRIDHLVIQDGTVSDTIPVRLGTIKVVGENLKMLGGDTLTFSGRHAVSGQRESFEAVVESSSDTEIKVNFEEATYAFAGLHQADPTLTLVSRGGIAAGEPQTVVRDIAFMPE